MATRLELQAELKTILGNSNVYFQPPESVKLRYPCIVYQLANINERFANNDNYQINKSYKVTLIHDDPDNDVVDILTKRMHCRFNAYFCKDNLHHYVFTLFNDL